MGFLISKEFPSRFLSADEITGLSVDLVIKDIKRENAFNRFKTNKEEPVLVAYFEGKDRGIRLGKERAMELKEITGSEDTDKWKGCKVNVFTQKKNIQKKSVNVLHFRAVENKASDDKDLNNELNLLSQ